MVSCTAAAARNIRMILAQLGALWDEIVVMLMAIIATARAPKPPGIAPEHLQRDVTGR